MKKKDLQELWKNYKNSDEKDKLYYRNKLIEYYYNYVQQIAWKMGEKLNWNVTHDELTSFGIDGLIHAIKKFDLKKNINFKAYANQRIKGSMIDGIRREDKIPRSVRLKQSHIQKIKKKLEEQKQREVTEKEV
ncbi:MAG: sigma-70 family RNA polymerase sigma factor [archaeon]